LVLWKNTKILASKNKQGEGNTFPFFLLILNNKQMTKAQEFMTAVEENNLFNHYSVIALRKEVTEQKMRIEYLDILLDKCITEKSL